MYSETSENEISARYITLAASANEALKKRAAPTSRVTKVFKRQTNTTMDDNLSRARILFNNRKEAKDSDLSYFSRTCEELKINLVLGSKLLYLHVQIMQENPEHQCTSSKGWPQQELFGTQKSYLKL